MLTPLALLSTQLLILENVIDPIKYIYTLTGATAIVILFLSISISLIKKQINFIKYRKLIGLFGFFYAFLHLINFIVFDADLDVFFIIDETLDKPFIYLGMIAFFILLFIYMKDFFLSLLLMSYICHSVYIFIYYDSSYIVVWNMPNRLAWPPSYDKAMIYII